jgi:hypothetical protein
VLNFLDFGKYLGKKEAYPMFKNRIILGILILGITIQISFAENVKFKSDIKDKDGNPVMLTGILTKPEGKGPFSAVVLLHGASGMQYGKTLMEPWSNRLVVIS